MLRGGHRDEFEDILGRYAFCRTDDTAEPKACEREFSSRGIVFLASAKERWLNRSESYLKAIFL